MVPARRSGARAQRLISLRIGQTASMPCAGGVVRSCPRSVAEIQLTGLVEPLGADCCAKAPAQGAAMERDI
jgi:hypothetical protein